MTMIIPPRRVLEPLFLPINKEVKQKKKKNKDTLSQRGKNTKREKDNKTSFSAINGGGLSY